MRRWNARSGPVWGQKSTKWTPRGVANKVSSSLEVGLLRARAQTKVDEVYGPYGSSPNPPSLRRQSSRKPYNISENHTNSKKIT